MRDIESYFKRKDNVSLGKLLKEVENQTEHSRDIMKYSSLNFGKSHIVGITGPPGVGKSTIVNKICKSLAEKNVDLGVICIDPTSPFTQGALLGDRIRMQELIKYPNIFIKSLATRGNLGGLTSTTADIVQVMDAFQKDIILIETVGVGQIELDILNIADTIIFMNAPGLGDMLQTSKAGVMEIADIFVINQADRPGANDNVKDLKMMIRESEKRNNWRPPVVKTIATEGDGIDYLLTKVEKHEDFLKSTKQWEEKREQRIINKLKQVIDIRWHDILNNKILKDGEVKEALEKVKHKEKDPYEVSEKIIQKYIK